jgi:hypothetical protein
LSTELRYPVVDAALHVEREEWWLLMRDVSAGVRPRGTYSEADCRRLLSTCARMHARFWQHPGLEDAPLGTIEGTTRIFALPQLQIARGGQVESHPWVEEGAEQLGQVLGLVTPFLDHLGSDDGDFFLGLIAERERWQRPLRSLPATLNHGDLRRANIAYYDDHISVFDWEMATAAHPAADMQWFWFLRFWAYPPDDGMDVDGREPLRQLYVDALDEALGGKLDRDEFERAWDLGWLRIIAQLGLCLADGEPDVAGPRCRRALARCRRICDDRQL